MHLYGFGCVVAFAMRKYEYGVGTMCARNGIYSLFFSLNSRRNIKVFCREIKCIRDRGEWFHQYKLPREKKNGKWRMVGVVQTDNYIHEKPL